jgi:N-methylhydantoinase A
VGARVIGVDTGGTFTDLVAVDKDGQVQVAKVPSTPSNPADAILDGIAQLGGLGPGDRIVHGTTVALNALLTGRIAKVAFVTGSGFRDLIEVGRQDRPDIYALEPERPRPLVERDCRFEINARIWPKVGSTEDKSSTMEFVLEAEPTTKELTALARRVKRSGAESVAIGLLHSWADPRQEKLVAAALEPLGLPLTCSGVVLPEHREVERFSTALVNAALVPIMKRYLDSLEARLGGAPLSILQSSGGTVPAERAATEPVRVILSGPAGGVIGAARAVSDAGFDAFVGLDMGGTSTDVAFHRAGLDAAFLEATKPLEPIRIGGHPVAVPTLDIHTIGCGGGSLVSVDAGGVLHVGPASAGADPGPVAYGKSKALTVTDAHVFLGHVAPGNFLGGALELDLDGVAKAFEALGKKLGVKPVQAAKGVLEVARAAMQRAIGLMTMQRGKDPAALPLVGFGGAGGLQVAALVEAMHMQAGLVPMHPGALSAAGMTHAAGLADLAHAVVDSLDTWPAKRRRALQRELAQTAKNELIAAGAKAGSIHLEQALELRYRGQSFEVRVPESAQAREVFHATHERLYGYRLEQREIELVCLRTRATVKRAEAGFSKPRRRKLPKAALLGTRSAWFESKVKAQVIDRAALAPGHTFKGPALIEEYSGTTLLPPNWNAQVTAGGHLLLCP